MLTKSIRVIGLLLIIAFSAVSIFLSLTQRDVLFIERGTKTFGNYTSYFEDRFYDLRMGMTFKDDYQSKDIVFAKIDEPTLEKYGRCFMSRKYGPVLRQTAKLFSKVVVFDVFFPEKEIQCRELTPDIIFKESIQALQLTGTKVIIPYSLVPLFGLQNESGV